MSRNLLDIIKSIDLKKRKTILIIFDSILISLSFLFSFFLVNNFADIYEYNFYWFIIFSIILGISLYLLTGQYRGIIRYSGAKYFYQIIYRNTFLVSVLFVVSQLSNLNYLDIKFWIVNWLILNCKSGFSRYIMRDLIIKTGHRNSKNLSRVAIYGGGSAGAQLLSALRNEGNHKVITIFDDSPKLWGRFLDGVLISRSEDIKNYLQNIDQIFLAMPSIGKFQLRKIYNNIQKFNIPTYMVPSIEELTKGEAKIDTLRPLDISDILERKSINFENQYLKNDIKNSVICVTGAGGSIGSEICRQILYLEPLKLILIEQSEASLYSIHQELIELNNNTEIKPILGNASNENLLSQIFNDEKVDKIFHAAAHKHVPLVEFNPLEGLKNNIFSTRSICISALKSNIKQVVLISSDKAVRPTNVMGLSKRIAELVVQSFAEYVKKNKQDSNLQKPLFSMVRFGNVLESSGSVVPLFRKQIAKGGPITLTDENVERYFMSIKEASQLVLQASLLAKGGDVFLLDMGKPIKIKTLAKQMIKLSGLVLKDKKNVNGNIEIISTGLRPGEKLYEELLIDPKNSNKTELPLVYRALEKFIKYEELWPKLDKLEEALIHFDNKKVFKIASELVPEWQSSLLNS